MKVFVAVEMMAKRDEEVIMAVHAKFIAVQSHVVHALSECALLARGKACKAKASTAKARHWQLKVIKYNNNL